MRDTETDRFARHAAPGRRLRGLTLTDLVDVQTLQEAQESFAELGRVGIVIRGPQGEMITQPSCLNQFCSALLQHPDISRQCQASHNELPTDPGHEHGVQAYACHAGLRQFAVPIVVRGRTYGTIIVGPVADRDMDDETIRRLADHLGLPVDEVRRHAATVRRWSDQQAGVLVRGLEMTARSITELCLAGYDLRCTVEELRLVQEVGHELVADRSLEDTMSLVARRITGIFGARACLIRLFETDRGTTKVLASHGLTQGYLEKGPVGVATELERVAIEGAVSVIEDIEQDERFLYRDAAREEGLRSAIYAGLICRGKALGGLRLYFGEPRDADESELRLVRALADQAALAIENARLIGSLRRTNQRLREAYELMHGAQDKLRQTERLAALGEMASGIAHEVKNPQAAVYGLARLLRDQHDQMSPEQVSEFLDTIMREARRTTGIVDMVRQFSRERQAGMAVVPVTEVLDDVIALQRFDEAVRRTRIETDYGCHPEVDGNADRLRQVFLNLIRNAGQALQGRSDGRIDVRVRQEGQQVIIEVADNGPGVPVEIQERVWEPFYSTRGAEGTGLGLDICRQIVAQHRGTIGLESVPGRGATFTVRLPASGSGQPEEPEDADGESPA